MFSRKKKVPVQKSAGRQRQPMDFGIPGIPGFDPNIEDDTNLEAELLALTGGRKENTDDLEIDIGGDDDDLEAELARILGGKSNKKKVNPDPPRRKPPIAVDPLANVDSEANSDDDIDENDPELLGELQMLTCEDEEEEEQQEDEVPEQKNEDIIPSQMEQLKLRLEMYKAAERNAKATNESARARRFNRGVKTLEKLVRRAEAGEVVPFDEIPPEISKPGAPAAGPSEEVKVDQPDITPKAPVLSEPIPIIEPLPKEINEDVPEPMPTLVDKGNEKQLTSLDPNDSAPSEPVPLRTVSNEDSTPDKNVLPIEPISNSSVLPQRPSSSSILEKLKTRRDQYRRSAVSAKNEGNKVAALEFVRAVKGIESLITKVENGEVIAEDLIPPPPLLQKSADSTPRTPAPSTSTRQAGQPLMLAEVFTVPKTVSEALNQRLVYYTKLLKKSEMAGLKADAKKAGDIVRIYQNAIKLHQRGSHVPFEKLPTPPGCPPIPLVFKI